MMLFRKAKDTDIEAIYNLSQKSGVGMTTLPKNKDSLKARIRRSTESFNKIIQKPATEYYLFVLEDKGNIVGVSAIEAKIGDEIPCYSYKITKHTQICHSLNIRNDYEMLTLVNDHQGCTELCTLFLNPDYRRAHNGVLLSKARFLFMAQYPERFEKSVIAELRGCSNEQGISPFWKHVAQHFLHMTYEEADKLTLETNKQFIADLMAHHPIYIPLLHPDARAVIGKPHQNTLPAMNMLMGEGFYYSNYVDIFDAGPTMTAQFSEINTIASSQIMTIENVLDKIEGPEYLLSNTQIDFGACVGPALVNIDNTCLISKEAAQLLNVGNGDTLCLARLKHNPIT